MEPKGNSIELSTFLKYCITKVKGHKTVEAGGKTQIESSSNVIGSAKTTLAFINGRNSVTKHQV